MRNAPSLMGGRGRGAWGRQFESDSYQANTYVRRVTRVDPGSGADAYGTLGAFVRAQLALGEGTPQFQAWVHRAATRLGG